VLARLFMKYLRENDSFKRNVRTIIRLLIFSQVEKVTHPAKELVFQTLCLITIFVPFENAGFLDPEAVRCCQFLLEARPRIAIFGTALPPQLNPSASAARLIGLDD
jgi:hypothetical protein